MQPEQRDRLPSDIDLPEPAKDIPLENQIKEPEQKDELDQLLDKAAKMLQ